MAISLISVLVSENLLDEAWAAAVANPGEFPESQWFQLIEVREKDRPADVIRPTAQQAGCAVESAQPDVGGACCYGLMTSVTTGAVRLSRSLPLSDSQAAWRSSENK